MLVMILQIVIAIQKYKLEQDLADLASTNRLGYSAEPVRISYLYINSNLYIYKLIYQYAIN